MNNVFDEIEAELLDARSKYPQFHSCHEGYAVIKEELDELWDVIKSSKRMNGDGRMREECVQVAAMAIRFMEDLCQ